MSFNRRCRNLRKFVTFLFTVRFEPGLKYWNQHDAAHRGVETEKRWDAFENRNLRKFETPLFTVRFESGLKYSSRHDDAQHGVARQLRYHHGKLVFDIRVVKTWVFRETEHGKVHDRVSRWSEGVGCARRTCTWSGGDDGSFRRRLRILKVYRSNNVTSEA